MTVLISALALLILGHNKPIHPGEEIFVRTDKTVPIERLAKAVAPMGRIESRLTGKPLFLIQLNPGVDDDKAKEKLAKLVGVHPLEPEQEPVDFRSVRSIDRKIRHLMADEQDERQKKHSKVRSHKKDEVDYLRAYRYFVSQRAYPHDSVDWTALNKGRAHARQMPKLSFASKPGVQPDTAVGWQFVGPTNLQVPYQIYYGMSPVNGRVNSVTFDPNNSQTIYAGGAQGGLWRSTDSGTTWTWLSSTWDQLAVNKVIIDPNNSNIIYVARGDYHGMIGGSYGILKSVDGGQTWTEIAETTMGQIGVAGLLMDPTNDQVLIAGTGDVNNYGKLYRSINGGSTWTQISISGTDALWPALTATATSGTTVRFYALAAGTATTMGTTQRLFKSDDHGATWQAVTSPLTGGTFHWAYAVAASPTNVNNVYILDSEDQELYTTVNKGTSWTNQTANLPTGNETGTANYNFSQGYYDYHLECGNRVVSNVNTDVLYLGEIDLQESLDGGNTWTSIGGPTYDNNAISHNDQHSLSVCPTNPNLAVFSNDGGVYTVLYDSSTATNTVTPLNQNLGVSMFYKLAMHPTNVNYILGGTQDNASPLSTGDLSNWQNVGAGDGGGSAINQSNPLIQYTSSEDFSIANTTDGWNTQNDISPNVASTENLPFVCCMVLDPNNPNLMYTGTNYLYQWNQNTQSWTGDLGNQDLTEGTADATIQAIAIAPTDSTRIYTGSTDGALYMSTNQGKTWKRLNPNASTLPDQSINAISVSPTNENDILIGLSGTGQKTSHIYRCSNTTASTLSFQSLSGSGATGLPDVSLDAIARDLDNPATTWWISMDVGVFVTTDAGQTWSNAGSSTGLPNVIVSDLVAVPGTRYLNAGTYGTGAWRLYLPVQAKLPTLTNFTISPSTLGLGATATGTVTLSAAAPAAGFSVTLQSSAAATLSVPASVTVPSGATSVTFTATAASTLTKDSSAVITASANGVTLTDDVTVDIPALSSLTVSPTSIVGGGTSTGTVSISVAAPPEGTVVTLKSSSAKATVPSSVTVPSGQTSTTFTIATSAVTASTSATITAKYLSVSKTATLSVKPLQIQSLTLSTSSLVGGSQASVTGTVTLAGPAPSAGLAVTLSSTSADAKVPTTVTVPSGATTATFAITHSIVATATKVTIKGTCGGASESATLTLEPFLVTSYTLSPTSVVGGNPTTGTITLSAIPASSPVTVKLTSSTTSAVPPTSVKVLAGSNTATATVATKAVAKTTTATLKATVGSSSQSTSLTIAAPTLLSLSVSPATVQGSSTSTVTGTVTISSPAPTGGLSITLKSSATSAATVPSTVVIAAGKTTGTFKVTHKKVASSVTVTITGTLASTSSTATLVVTP